MTSAVEPFAIHIPDADIDDLRRRLRATRWPDAAPGEPWSQGMDLGALQRLASIWADEFDWAGRERWLATFSHVQVPIDGARIHAVHAVAADGGGIPLILTHGWPSTFLEYLPLVPLLTDPGAHGIESPAFDLVIPSLPGYAFSERPATSLTTRGVAAMWHRLMRALGYSRYGAGGGDFGSAVATFMALDKPASVLGLHLSNLDVDPYTGPGAPALSDAERAYLEQRAAWDAVERGYSEIQSTKPQTIGYGLTDSPVGLAAWVLEKWRSWTDSDGDLEARFARDDLLTMLTIIWATRSITSSMRDYYDNRWSRVAIGRDDRVRVPTGFARFDHEFLPEGSPPREWVERLYDVRRWTPMPRGGHFAAAEEPGLLARDIAGFFGSI